MSATLTKTQAIAAEKQKLIEREKEIAEKLRLMKQAHNAAASRIVKDKSAPARVQSSVAAPKPTQSNRIYTASTRMRQNKQQQQKEQLKQDVIHITPAPEPNPTMEARQRRKSVLDSNSSTTPNIPLTPRRSISRDSQGEEYSGLKGQSRRIM